MAELVSIFTDTAAQYRRQGLHGISPHLRARAKCLRQRIQAMQALRGAEVQEDTAPACKAEPAAHSDSTASAASDAAQPVATTHLVPDCFPRHHLPRLPLSTMPSPVPPLLREEYDTEEAIAIIGTWKKDPARRQHLLRLANLWDDEEKPQTQLSRNEMAELVVIFRDTAAVYCRQGVQGATIFLMTQADYLCQCIQNKQAQTEDEQQAAPPASDAECAVHRDSLSLSPCQDPL